MNIGKLYGILWILILLGLFMSCSNTYENTVQEIENVVMNTGEESSENIPQEINNLIFRVNYREGGLCSILFDENEEDVAYYNVTIEGNQYRGYKGRPLYINSDIIDGLIRELSVEKLDDDNNILGSWTYNNLFIYNAENQKTIDILESTFLDTEVLYVINAEDIEQLDSIEKLKQLKCLVVDGSLSLKDINALKNLHSLEILDLSDGMQINDLSSIAELTNLKELRIKFVDCTPEQGVENQNILSSLKDLRILGLSNFQFDNLDFLVPLIHLKVLEIEGNSMEVNYSEIGNIGELRQIVIEGTPDNIVNISIDDFRNIEIGEFSYVDFEGTTFIRGDRIKSIEFNYCTNVEFCNEIQLGSIENLWINSTPIANLNHVFSDKLKRLTFENVDISNYNIDDLSQKTYISIIGDKWNAYDLVLNSQISKQVTNISLQFPSSALDLSGYSNLEHLDLYGINDNGDYAILFSSIRELENLKELSLAEIQTTDYSFINDIENLTQLNITGCYGDVSLDFLRLENLESVNLADHIGVVEFKNISNGTKLLQLGLWEINVKNYNAIGRFDFLNTMVLVDMDTIDADILSRNNHLKYLYAFNTEIPNANELRENGVLIEMVN